MMAKGCSNSSKCEQGLTESLQVFFSGRLSRKDASFLNSEGGAAGDLLPRRIIIVDIWLYRLGIVEQPSYDPPICLKSKKESRLMNQPTEKLPRVLIVEDDERLASLTQEYLIRNGLEVGVEMDGNRAIRRIIEGSAGHGRAGLDAARCRWPERVP
jgi:CheY-like chemotaxis protein